MGFAVAVDIPILAMVLTAVLKEVKFYYLIVVSIPVNIPAITKKLGCG